MTNRNWQSLAIDKAGRARSLQQTPRCIWFTGLSGAGKSTIADLLEQRLHARGLHTYLLDGDNVRHGLNSDLGFAPADRADRQMARSLFAEGEFVEVFVDASLAVCEQRGPKGLYAKARRGELKNFTGIDSPAAQFGPLTTRSLPTNVAK